ncbi:MAG: energy-coupling factor ABC transporter ATP-binding protein [Geobacteraceae bacterium]|nr:energy-coupling factor ABC transporter ATP-binding protein [Geobacteraceae bacterium]
MTSAMLEFDRVTHSYADRSRGLDNCTLAIPPNSRTAILGKNGAGKTTLLLHCNGILKPQSGTIRYGGQPLTYQRDDLIRLRTDVGIVFQNPDNQLFSASVREDIAFGPLNLGLPKDEVLRRVDEALTTMHLHDCAHKPVQNLSFGQKKRVCLAGVLAMHPQVLILDEPMTGLDPAMQRELLAQLDKLQAAGLTLILATHDIDFAFQWSDTLVFMHQGACAARFPTGDLAEHQSTLSALGFELPRVVQLWNAMRPDKDLPPPRSVKELCVHIMENKKGTPE